MFEPGRITIQYFAVGFLPWCAATIAFVEAAGLTDEEKNGLCPPVVFSGDASDLLRLAYPAMRGLVARARHEAVGPWSAASRLNPARDALDHIDDADVAKSLAFMIEHTRGALENLERLTATEGAAAGRVQGLAAPVKAYKFLTADGLGVFSGFAWPLPNGGPGDWVEVEVAVCRSGVHACRTGDLSYWLAPALYEIELDGDIAEAGMKVVAPRGRLVRRVDGWDDETREAYSQMCIARAGELAAKAPKQSARGRRGPRHRPQDPR